MAKLYFVLLIIDVVLGKVISLLLSEFMLKEKQQVILGKKFDLNLISELLSRTPDYFKVE